MSSVESKDLGHDVFFRIVDHGVEPKIAKELQGIRLSRRADDLEPMKPSDLLGEVADAAARSRDIDPLPGVVLETFAVGTTDAYAVR